MNPGQPVTYLTGSTLLLSRPPVASAGHASRTAGNHRYGSTVKCCSNMLPILNKPDVQFRYDACDGESPAKALARRQSRVTIENHCPPNQLARELTRTGKCSTDYFVAFCQRMARAEKNPDAVTQSPLYPLYQELSHIHYKEPSLPDFFRYLATGQYPVSSFRRPYLQTMIDLCQAHPGITLHQLMTGLDRQSQEGFSELSKDVKSLLRFRDHRWEAPALLPEKAQEPGKPDDSALTGSAGAKNARQRLNQPCSGLAGGILWGTLMGNIGRAFSEGENFTTYNGASINGRALATFDLATACSIGDTTFTRQGVQYYVFGMAPPDFGFGKYHSEFCSNFCVAPDLQRNRYQTQWAREIGVQRCTNAMNKMTSLFSEDRADELCPETRIGYWRKLFPSYDIPLTRHGCLNTYADNTCKTLVANNIMTDPFCNLCDAAKDPAMRCNPLPQIISGVTIDHQEYPLDGLCDFSGDPRLSYQGYQDICQEYCINNMGAPNSNTFQEDWWWQVGEARCQQAKNVIGQVFDVQTAHHNFSCNPIWDTTARIPLHKTGCLLNYLDQKCRYLTDTNQTSDPFCKLCDASRDPVKRCNPIRETIIPASMPTNSTLPASIPANSTIPASIPANSTIPASMPANSTIPASMPTNSTIPASMPTNSTIPASMPTNSTVPASMPTNSTIPASMPANSTIPASMPTNSTIPASMPANSTIPASMPTNSTIPASMPTNSTIPASIPANSTIPASMPANSTIPASMPANSTIPASMPAIPTAGNIQESIPAAGISVMAAGLIGTTVGIGAAVAITGLCYLYHRWRKGSGSSENRTNQMLENQKYTTGRSRNMYVSPDSVINVDEFSDIKSLSISDENISKAGSSEKPIKLNDSASETTPLQYTIQIRRQPMLVESKF